MNRSQTYDSTWSKVGAPLAAQAVLNDTADQAQYSLRTILGIWAAAALPMAILGWLVAPLIGNRVDLGVGDENRVVFMRGVLLMFGLIWQFVLVMAIVVKEEGNLRWSTIRRRCWLNTPRDPKTGQTRARLWLWLIPFGLLFAVLQFAPIDSLFESVFPFLGEPDKYSLEKLMMSDERKAALEGAWQVFGFFIVLGVFNTILGEELLFRGILLPKMRGVFGKGDWVANGVLFGLYHLHQPWSIPLAMIDGSLCQALPARRFRSAWMGIITHSTQTVFFSFIALGLVLGMA